MIKKWTLTILAATTLAVPALPAFSFAEDRPVELNHGQLKNNRVLIPLRDVSQNMGATVEWNQQRKTIQIHKDDIDMLLTINAKSVLVNQTAVELDVPPEIINNVTYVPLRFISQTLGADIDWNPYGYQATITLQGKQIIVNVDRSQPSALQKATVARLKQLSDKLNEASDVSAMQQIRTYFKPYFTDRLINTIILNRGLNKAYAFEAPNSSPFYTSRTTARLSQSLEIGHDGHEIHSIYRLSNYVYVDGAWKVDTVSFEQTSIPISGA